MQGAVFVGQGEPLVVEELELTGLGPNDVRVRFGASGVCHSDLSVISGHFPIPPPNVLGHEGAGVVEEVGPNVTRVAPGDTVVASWVPACGRCVPCLRGDAQLCDAMLQAFDPHFRRTDGSVIPAAVAGTGTFAEAAILSETSVVKLETSIPMEQLAIIGCALTTGVGAVLNTARVEPGSTVVVVGCGGVGQSAIQGARIAGASTIIAVDTVADKLETARKLGATDTVEVDADTDAVDAVMSLTSGRGADYAFEVIGNVATFEQAYQMTRRGGTVVAVGLPGVEATSALNIYDVIFNEKKILGSLYGSAQVMREFPRMARFVESGQLDVSTMVTNVIPLHGINDAFDAMRRGEGVRSVITY